MSESPQPSTEERTVSIGQRIFDSEGNKLGRIRGLDEHGFYVTTEQGIRALSTEHTAGSKGGEKLLMWRCWECGAIGKLNELPEECPDCGAGKEELYYWQED
ncbi:DUF7130 family rubredoxin-like protein [Natronomonas sp. EA1]|uniref:DUF7130 family rubredoxin-like protein n=1 Tax=Natronomonas sp. EA1 TaxID=3421655 RepID=UPI003EBEBD12